MISCFFSSLIFFFYLFIFIFASFTHWHCPDNGLQILSLSTFAEIYQLYSMVRSLWHYRLLFRWSHQTGYTKRNVQWLWSKLTMNQITFSPFNSGNQTQLHSSSIMRSSRLLNVPYRTTTVAVRAICADAGAQDNTLVAVASCGVNDFRCKFPVIEIELFELKLTKFIWKSINVIVFNVQWLIGRNVPVFVNHPVSDILLL